MTTIDRIRAEIERRKGYISVTHFAEDILSFIDSLQQEQPDFPTTDEQIKEFLAAHPKIEVPEKYKNPDWLFKQQEQPEVDCDELDEAAQAYANGPDVAWVGTSALECAFKAGAKWKYQKDRAAFAKLKAKEWMSGYNEGLSKAKEEKQ